ncbi:hypothetical protein Hanom_Chr10g00884221 [Helianthus anomalus]
MLHWKGDVGNGDEGFGFWKDAEALLICNNSRSFKYCCRVFLGLRLTEIIAYFLEILTDVSEYEYNF